jgi:hypothetical protein
MVTEKKPETQQERVQTIRDIEREAALLAGEDAPQEIIFKDISPGRKKMPLWRVRDGREIQVPKYMLANVLAKRDPATGEYIFTGKQSDAAEYKPGTVLCFLHADSPEQAILSEIGLSANPCPKATLRNNHSKRMHAKHRHKQEWEAYEEYLDDKKEAQAVERQQKQLEATLALAGKSAEAPNGTCDVCGKTSLKNVGAHKRGAHKDR